MKTAISYIVTIALIFIICSGTIAQSISYEQYKLSNSLRVILIDYGTVEATTINVYVNVGKKNETPGYQGISGLTAQALTLGNEKYDLIKQEDSLYPLGAYISASANDNYTCISSTFLNNDLEKGMNIFAAAVRQPTFPEEEIKQQISEFMQYNDPKKMDIAELAGRFSDFFVYGVSNPLGRNAYAKQVGKLTSKDIKDFYDFNYTPKNTEIVVAGKLDKVKIKKLIETYFGKWETVYGENNQVSLETPSFKGKQYAFVNRDSATQVCLNWAKKAPQATDKELNAFKVASVIFNLKLFEEIREKLGKTYGIYMSYSEYSNNNVYTVTTQTRSREMTATLLAFEKTLNNFYSNGLTDVELKLAKSKLKNEYLSLNNPASIIDYFNPIVYPDIDKRKTFLNDLDALTLDAVNKTIKKYFNPDSYKLIIAGNETELENQLLVLSGLQKYDNTAIEVDQ